MKYRICAAITCLVILGTAAVYAQKFALSAPKTPPQIKLTLTGTIDRNAEAISIEKAGAVSPGETILWVVKSVNEGGSPAVSHDAITQIPVGTTLILESVSADAQAVVAYSIDGGKLFSQQPTITQRQADGSMKQVSAPISMYSNIRYHWDTPLPVAAQRLASYKVRIN